ncbi:MAG: CDP-alcohol phosphatidyltransferase family protein [Austwickia sp.]|nr:CDP-alcohol phosphatidyltransferase family protein [Actinomycetota bacterium]MCB1251648.1 CDP-alcohol phosphatidyltransferase family protein [Austwickia sp.]MCO5310947.1 CDP-alcohol phosphatidyltransferase family protein [Austwickia sp.]
MLNKFARAFVTRLLTPVARLALRVGLTPDMVTIIGTIGVCLGALIFYPRHEFLIGTLVIAVFVFSDTLDGTMARLSGQTSRWGAFIDSTLDRIGDGAVFGGLLLCFASRPGMELTAWFALACLVFGFVTSYARARAEGLGVTAANVGIAERADRLVVALVGTGLTGLFGLPDIVLTILLGLLALASAVTVLQRMIAVRRHILAES